MGPRLPGSTGVVEPSSAGATEPAGRADRKANRSGSLSDFGVRTLAPLPLDSACGLFRFEAQCPRELTIREIREGEEERYECEVDGGDRRAGEDEGAGAACPLRRVVRRRHARG